MDKKNTECSQRIRREVNRYFQRMGKNNLFDISHDPNRFEAVICAYINSNNNIDYKPEFVHLCAPFIFTIHEEYDAFYCFESLMQTLDDFNRSNPVNSQVALFLSWFRSFLPDLYGDFQDEDINLSEFVSAWLKSLLASQLPLGSILQLWDVYLSTTSFLDFHPFVCLSILSFLKDSLEELEYSEIRAIIFRLPEIDIPRLTRLPTFNQKSNNIKSN
ncbi:hypothetical protein BB560_005500 [Smittium megazygosporum]|uniref:Rab-GAP TBC domain-containing protein n=1 Tax=Smittium megazygosporum TaxID=133381 RepID=A0A2T9Z4A8_9FUNG|nr:hypothetical protein BB560_005500 [Smittium megazygosporum]